jgi:D-3-phosphoglycerate dehydrogenase / 2-oxoglutarate reductase
MARMRLFDVRSSYGLCIKPRDIIVKGIRYTSVADHLIGYRRKYFLRNWKHLFKSARIVRLNAELFPVNEYETEVFARFGLSLVQVEATTPKEIIPHVANADAVCVVSAALPAPVIDGMKRCRIISRHGIGCDKIDVALAKERGIVVANVPGFCSTEMGEHAMALLLAVARKLPQSSDAMTRGAWNESREIAGRTHRLTGQVLGLVGFGDSAIMTAQRAKGFGFRILATRRRLGESSPEARELGIEMVDFETLLASSDYLSLHLPLTPETYHLFDDFTLRRMKRGAVLINTARGALVDEIALANILQEGWLSGAGIDTFEQIDPFSVCQEPPCHPLLDLKNVVFTPHVAALSEEAMQTVKAGMAENVAAVLSSHWPRHEHIVNPGVEPRAHLTEFDPGLFDDPLDRFL